MQSARRGFGGRKCSEPTGRWNPGFSFLVFVGQTNSLSASLSIPNCCFLRPSIFVKTLFVLVRRGCFRFFCFCWHRPNPGRRGRILRVMMFVKYHNKKENSSNGRTFLFLRVCVLCVVCVSVCPSIMGVSVRGCGCLCGGYCIGRVSSFSCISRQEF